jgi:hypothetical protein
MLYQHKFKSDLNNVIKQINILSGIAFINDDSETASTLKNVANTLSKLAKTSKIENEMYDSDDNHSMDGQDDDE